MLTLDQASGSRRDVSESHIGGAIADPPAAVAYSARQAARLIGFAPATHIYPALRSLLLPRIRAALAPGRRDPASPDALSFLDLLQVRFVAALRMRGAKLRPLRAAIDAMMDRLATPHPFVRQAAYSFCTDGMLFRETFLESAIATGDQRLSALLSETTGGYDALVRELVTGVEFDKETRLIRSWAPRPKQFPAILVDPRVAGGQPAGPSGVPTARLRAAWKAERREAAAVARLYGLARADVLEAIRFEELLGAKRPTQSRAQL